MTEFDEIIREIENEDHRETFQSLIDWVDEHYPDLDKAVKWSNPCYENEGTFILSMTPYKGHLAINLEKAGIDHFAEALEKSPYSTTEMTFRVKWNQEMDYDLLADMIDFQFEDKKGLQRYWRK